MSIYENVVVPRDLLATLTLSWQLGLEISDEINQLRQILAAPVVERQPFAYYFRFAGYVTTDGPQGWRTEIEIEKPAEFLFDDGRVKDFTPLYKEPPELAELQATIARLTAENERLAAEALSDRHESWMTGAEIGRKEIERLKGGQGEPVLWLKHLFGAECKSNGQTYDVMFCEMPGYTPLFTSQPAPVSVVLPERLPTEDNPDQSPDYDEGWNACLDKVKELNQ